MTFKEFVLNTLSEDKNPSSKRVAGCLGWFLCLVSAIIGIFYEIKSTDIIEMLFWASSGLLGLDSVTGMFKNKRRGGDDNQISC